MVRRNGNSEVYAERMLLGNEENSEGFTLCLQPYRIIRTFTVCQAECWVCGIRSEEARQRSGPWKADILAGEKNEETRKNISKESSSRSHMGRRRNGNATGCKSMWLWQWGGWGKLLSLIGWSLN